jgi:cell division septation protein DedD
MSKSYEFSFRRGQLVKLVSGLVSLVLLVFVAGFLAALALEMGQQAPVLIAQFPPALIPAQALVAPEDLPAVEPVSVELAEDDQPAIEEKNDVEVVAETPEPAQAVQPAQAAQAELDGKFAVQLGAFLSSRNAEKLSKKLEARGYSADVVTREDSHGRTWYLVRFGLYQNRAQASVVALELKTREMFDAVVRPSNSM